MALTRQILSTDVGHDGMKTSWLLGLGIASILAGGADFFVRSLGMFWPWWPTQLRHIFWFRASYPLSRVFLTAAVVTGLLSVILAAVVMRQQGGTSTCRSRSFYGGIFGGVGLLLAVVVCITLPWRPAPSVGALSICQNNLRSIDSAKGQVALSLGLTNGDPIAEDDLLPYLKSGKMPSCPHRGIYTTGTVGTKPRCNEHGQLSRPFRTYEDVIAQQTAGSDSTNRADAVRGSHQQ